VDSVKFRFQFENSTSDATLGDNQERLVRGLVEARKIRVHFEGNLEGDCGEAAAVTCKEWLIPARTDTRIDFQQR
jgi:hypothetical protein